MLIYILIAIVIVFIALFFIINKSKKKSRVSRTSVKKGSTSSTLNDTSQIYLTSDEIYQKITSLINDRNFFAAEVQINEWIKQNHLEPKAYLLLLEIYLLQNDELSIQELLDRLNTQDHQPILQLVKARIKDNSNTIETIEFELPSQSNQIVKKLELETTESNSKKEYFDQNFSISTSENSLSNDHSLNLIAVESENNQTTISMPSDPLLDAFPELEQTDEISLNFELAEKYIELGAYEDARRLIEEKEKSYNTAQRNQANQLLKQIAS